MTGGSFSQRSKARLSPGQNSPRNFPSQPLKKSTKRNRNQKDSKTLPIPRGNSPYAMAKRAEYEERNLRKAEYYYKQSIKIGERVESALKDLASVLHQQGKTQEACELLRRHSKSFSSEPVKFLNLLHNLERQLIPSGNCLNKNLKVSPLTDDIGQMDVVRLFAKPSRIIETELCQEFVNGQIQLFAIVRFPSHSAARKTLESFIDWDKYKVEWVTIEGEVVGDASITKIKEERPPAFCYAVFDPSQTGYLSAVDQAFENELSGDCVVFDDSDSIKLLGKSLVATLKNEVRAPPLMTLKGNTQINKF